MSAKIKTGITGGICSVAVIIGLVLDSGKLRTSNRGLELIGNAEGCRRAPYNCPAGILTDGIGNTQGVKPGIRKTDRQIAADWEKNILDAERCVNRYANGSHLSDNTFSAVTSLTFNVGCSIVQKSTMFQLLRQGRTEQACQQFPRWVYADGRKLKGLVMRRDAEMQLCLDGLK